MRSGKCWNKERMKTAPLAMVGHIPRTPIGAAAGVANLKLIDDLNLVTNAGEVGAYLNTSMQQVLGDHPNVGGTCAARACSARLSL